MANLTGYFNLAMTRIMGLNSLLDDTNEEASPLTLGDLETLEKTQGILRQIEANLLNGNIDTTGKAFLNCIVTEMFKHRRHP